MQPIQMQLSRNRKIFAGFFLHFRNLHKILNTLAKKRASEVISFLNYRLKKAGKLKSLKCPVSEHLWTANILKGSETLIESAQQYFCHIFWWLWKKIRSTNSVLIVSEMLGLFFNILSNATISKWKTFFSSFFLDFRNLH